MTTGIKIVAAIFCVIVGVIVFLKVLRKHKLIDTESIAVVKDVQYLGRDEAKKVYAVRYDIKSSDPFELVVSPCKKTPKIGKQISIFYEKDNPKQNYYFKTIGNIDKRFLSPILFVLIGTFACIASVVELFG